MLEVLFSILGIIVSLSIGYFLSRYQSRKLIKSAIELLRPFETISLRDEFHMTNILANQICADSFVPDIIVSIVPGGGMIGEWLSQRFLRKNTTPICMCSLWMHVERDANGRHLSHPKPCGFLTPSLPSDMKKILIVNDISRTGRTLEEAMKFVKSTFQDSEIKMAVLFLSKDAQPPYPDFWVDTPSRRVVFRWKVMR